MCISALIITLNEEANLGNCLKSLQWCDDVVVLDSFSMDTTESIAREHGVRFEQRAFDNYATQRNFGLNAIPYKYPWVLMVDADEIVTEELAKEMLAAVAAGGDEFAMYRFRRKDFFLGKWIRRSGGYPTWFGRLVRLGRIRVEREVNEEYIADGKVGLLNGHILHNPFNKGFFCWIEKHNRYSTMEAQVKFSGNTVAKQRWRDCISSDPAQRRIFFKALLYVLPGRPLIVFLLLYLLRGGFLDGKAGLVFCLLRTFYELMIDIKVMELKLRSLGHTV
ncbi:MAG: glycosyltransferase family 2 protein [Candidatus Methylumidiphilus sp.]